MHGGGRRASPGSLHPSISGRQAPPDKSCENVRTRKDLVVSLTTRGRSLFLGRLRRLSLLQLPPREPRWLKRPFDESSWDSC